VGCVMLVALEVASPHLIMMQVEGNDRHPASREQSRAHSHLIIRAIGNSGRGKWAFRFFRIGCGVVLGRL